MVKGPISKILPTGVQGTEPPDNVTDPLPLPTIDERASLFLRAVYGERDFTNQEHADARDRILNEIASRIAAKSDDRSPDAGLPGMQEETGLPVDPASSRISDEDLGLADSASPQDLERAEGDRLLFKIANRMAAKSARPIAPARSPNKDPDRAARARAPIAESAHYRASAELPARANRSTEAAFPEAARPSPMMCTLSLPREGRVGEGARSASLNIPRRHSEELRALELRRRRRNERRTVAQRRVFVGAAAIAATVLLAAGAYRFAILLTEQAGPLQTASDPQKSSVAAETNRLCGELSREIAMREVIESCGEIAKADPTRPASREPDTVLLRVPNDNPAAKTGDPKNADAIANMVQLGQAFISMGKIQSARPLLKQAADSSAEAALALGATYDPIELEHLSARDGLPDLDAARRWYQKAKDLGAPEAQGRLDRLAGRKAQPH